MNASNLLIYMERERRLELPTSTLARGRQNYTTVPENLTVLRNQSFTSSVKLNVGLNLDTFCFTNLYKDLPIVQIEHKRGFMNESIKPGDGLPWDDGFEDFPVGDPMIKDLFDDPDDFEDDFNLDLWDESDEDMEDDDY